MQLKTRHRCSLQDVTDALKDDAEMQKNPIKRHKKQEMSKKQTLQIVLQCNAMK